MNTPIPVRPEPQHNVVSKTAATRVIHARDPYVWDTYMAAYPHCQHSEHLKQAAKRYAFTDDTITCQRCRQLAGLPCICQKTYCPECTA